MKRRDIALIVVIFVVVFVVAFMSQFQWFEIIGGWDWGRR